MARIILVQIPGAELAVETDAAGNTTSWNLINNTGSDVYVEFQLNKVRTFTAPMAPGNHTGNIPRNRRWNVNAPDDDPMSLWVEIRAERVV